MLANSREAETFITGDGHPRRRQILAVLCLSLLVVVVDNTLLNTALPTLARALHATTTDLQWITDAYTVAFAALLIVAGGLGDRYGRRGGLLVGLSVFAAGSAAAALSGGSGTLIAFRAVMGVGGAFVMPATLSILTQVFPTRERAQAIAAWSAIAGVAIVIGPTLGGLLLDHFSWHAVFWVNVPLAAAAIAAVAGVVPSLPTRRAAGEGLDLVGAILSATAMLATIDAVIEAPQRGWSDSTTLLELGAAVVLFSGFVVRELTAASPLIDVRVFRQRAFSAAVISVGVTFFALFGSLFALTQYLQLVHGYSPLSAGVRALPFAVALLITSPVSSLLAGRFGARSVIPVGLLTMAGGLMVLVSATPTTGVVHVSLGVALMGAGMGLIMAPAGESLMSVLQGAQAGVGSAVNDTVQELGGSLGVAIVGSLVSTAYQHTMATSHLPAIALHTAGTSIGAADATAAALAARSPGLAANITTIAGNGFTAAMGHGFVVAAVTATVAAIGLAFTLPGRNRPAQATPVDLRVSVAEPVAA